MNERNERRRPRLYNIPADVDALPALARAMLAGHLPVPGGAPPGPADLAGWTVFLPTRRSARELAAALLEAAPSDSQLLARIRPLGDIDEDELAMSAAAGGQLPNLRLPPPIAPLPRLFMLSRLIRQWAGGDDSPLAEIIRANPGEALKMARELARLIDSFENEETDFDAIGRLMERERPEHRLAAQDLLRHIREHYPRKLAEEGLMGAAARRAALIRAQADMLAAAPPDAPVIAAGSTGSHPATARLLSVIARLDNGCVILPGLDTGMDDKSWSELSEGHPQYGLRLLLERIGAHRSEVEPLPGLERPPHGPRRQLLLSEAMRPATTTDGWLRAVEARGGELVEGSRGLHHIHAPTRHLEALSIALIMRHALEREGRTAALVTPDRELARQVRAELDRWGITVDDSAGQPLSDTPPGAFIRLLMEAALEGFAPPALAALAAHPLACFGWPRDDFLHRFSALETAVLRGLAAFPGLPELPALVARRRAMVKENPHHEHRAVRALNKRWPEMEETATRMGELLAPLAEVFAHRAPRDFSALLRALGQVAETITTGPDGHCALWAMPAGEALAQAFATMDEHAATAPSFTPRDFAHFITAELAARPLRPPHGAHPRLSILGLLEARLVHADIKILGGLNEDIWPPAAHSDPFLNRPERGELSLPLPERRIGLSAHDFVQAAAGSKVWLTSSAKIDQQPAVPSRWLLRLQAVLAAAGEERPMPPPADMPVLQWAALLDKPLDKNGKEPPPRPISPPEPAPPVDFRPLSFSVSRAATLLSDPYSVFAADILGLEPLPPLEAAIGMRELGNIIHEALDKFARDYPDALPPDMDDVADEIGNYLLAAFDANTADAARRSYWQPRLKRMARWLAERERHWREDIKTVIPETSGGMELHVKGSSRPFRLTARADRIDLMTGERVRLLDYKTGQVPAPSPASDKYSPQLDLEAALVISGAFPELSEYGCDFELADVAYVRLTGGMPPGEITSLGGGEQMHGRAIEALEGLGNLLADYENPAQPYLPLGKGGYDYHHFSRWQEWMHEVAADDGGES